MPLSIDSYTQWAALNTNTEAALSKGAPGLDRASNQVGVLARFFGTKSAQNVRKAVIEDFTRALSAKYGASLAHEALASAGLTPTSKLDGKKIVSVETYARTHSDMVVDTLMRKDDIKLMTGPVTRAEVQSYSEQGMRNYLSVRRLAVDVLGETPLDAASFDDFAARASSIRDKLTSITNMVVVPPSGGTFAKIYADANALVQAIDAKINAMDALLKGQPLSDANKNDFKSVWAMGVLNALDALKGDSKCSAALRNAIDAVKQNITSNPQAFLDSMPVLKEMDKELASTVVGLLKAQVPAKEIAFKESFIAKQISDGYRKALNEGDWSPISKTITATVGGVPVELKSDIVPGASIGAPSEDAKGPIGDRYDPGVNGYMCHSAETSHAVNLAVSSITVDGADKPAFRGIRHGVHCAWEISNPRDRAAANVERAKEAVIAAFLADPDNDGKVHNGEISLKMVSVSLLTPDVMRPVLCGRGSNERLMLREQKAAWDAVSRDGVTFQHNGQTITIRPTVFTFNFGVNSGAVKYGSIAPDLAGGWGLSDDMNMRAHREMRPFVQAFVDDTSIPADKRKAVRTLFDQCMPVMKKGGERSDSHDAYKVAARFAVLTHLMGWTPCWNCKSGKDRTGQMDVECKFLATLVARGEDIPEPGAKLTTEQTALFRAIALEGGNFEMQKYNTGIGGFKTGGVDSIPERLGGQEYRRFHKGGADNVNV